jgi:hypothetical protein
MTSFLKRMDWLACLGAASDKSEGKALATAPYEANGEERGR